MQGEGGAAVRAKGGAFEGEAPAWPIHGSGHGIQALGRRVGIPAIEVVAYLGVPIAHRAGQIPERHPDVRAEVPLPGGIPPLGLLPGRGVGHGLERRRIVRLLEERERRAARPPAGSDFRDSGCAAGGAGGIVGASACAAARRPAGRDFPHQVERGPHRTITGFLALCVWVPIR